MMETQDSELATMPRARMAFQSMVMEGVTIGNLKVNAGSGIEMAQSNRGPVLERRDIPYHRSRSLVAFVYITPFAQVLSSP